MTIPLKHITADELRDFIYMAKSFQSVWVSADMLDRLMMEVQDLLTNSWSKDEVVAATVKLLTIKDGKGILDTSTVTHAATCPCSGCRQMRDQKEVVRL